MRRLLLLAAATVLAVLVPATPAVAITYGVPDGDAHPAVGGLVSPTQYSDGTWIYCSGTLISPTVFLTAAHCGETGERVTVTFDTAYQAGDPVYTGTFQADPLYTYKQNDPHDIAVVVLDEPVEGITPALLPEAGSLSGLSVGQPFTSVGYGAYEVTNSPGGHQYLYDDVRQVATGSLWAVNKAWLRISMNPATGDAVCRATNVVYRLDTEAARAFLGRYVTLP